tara:strand:- start:1304 stop:1531 length:228 start_codon:yes stop_codon:yes gene_type:complete
MNVEKWKSVAVKKKDYSLLKAICKEKFRAPGAMISKLIHSHVEYEAKKQKISTETLVNKLLNGDSNDDGKRSKKN